MNKGQAAWFGLAWLVVCENYNFPFSTISKLAEYFQDLDIVPTDLAAGLVLLRKQQKRQEHCALMRAIEEQQVSDSQVCK